MTRDEAQKVLEMCNMLDQDNIQRTGFMTANRSRGSIVLVRQFEVTNSSPEVT